MENTPKPNRRAKIPIATQVRILFRDGWICAWCGRPTIFPPAFKYLQEFIKSNKYEYEVAYYDPYYRRDTAPLLDHLAAVVDHLVPHSKGGPDAEDNLVTACNKCNMQKNDGGAGQHTSRHPKRPVRSRFGEPKHWDGLASFFMVYGRQHIAHLTRQEKEWLKAFEMYLATTRKPLAG